MRKALKALAVLGLIAGIICLVLAVTYMGVNDDLAAILAGIGVLLAGEAVFCLLHKKKAPKPGKPLCSATFRHAAGLPLAEGVKCRVESFPDRLSISAMNQVFDLPDEKIRALSVVTEKEVEKQFVPRLLWVRRKTIRTFTRYLVVSYADSPDEPGRTIVFQLGEWNVDKAKRLASLYNGRPAAHIDL